MSADRSRRRSEFVVAGEDAGSKLDRARERGVPIIDEAELRRLLRAASGPEWRNHVRDHWREAAWSNCLPWRRADGE